MSRRAWIRFGWNRPLWRCVPVWSWWWMKCIVGRKRTIKKAEPLGNSLWVSLPSRHQRDIDQSQRLFRWDQQRLQVLWPNTEEMRLMSERLSYKDGSYRLAPIKTKKHHETILEVVSITCELNPRSFEVTWCFIWRAVLQFLFSSNAPIWVHQSQGYYSSNLNIL